MIAINGNCLCFLCFLVGLGWMKWVFQLEWVFSGIEYSWLVHAADESVDLELGSLVNVSWRGCSVPVSKLFELMEEWSLPFHGNIEIQCSTNYVCQIHMIFHLARACGYLVPKYFTHWFYRCKKYEIWEFELSWLLTCNKFKLKDNR